MPTEERVLCFERRLLDELGAFHGLSFDVAKYLQPVTAPANLTYRLRREAEQDQRYKQLIPYVIIISHGRVLRYRRGRGGEETRLHGLYSVGVGGHISAEDSDLFDSAGYSEGMRREIREEVAIEPGEAPAVAVINDDSTEVGAVHFGIVHVMRVADEAAVGWRKGIVSPEFIEVSEAVRNAASYESWSRFCLENFDRLLSSAAPAPKPA
jgi:predicted NUDIX family phosphoesterase